jgi:hypothetical protein
MVNRDQLLHLYDYAFDEQPNLLDALADIRKGSGYADLVNDEGKLEGLGVKYKPLLDACNIDFSLVQRAGELKILLGDMLAQVDVEKMEKSPEKLLRDRAFTWLNKAMVKVRKCGRSVFWKDEDIVIHFSSPYQRKIRQKYERKKIAQKVAEEAVA